MNPELKRAAEIAAEYIESFDHHDVSGESDPETLRKKLQKDLTDEGLPPLQVINELAEDARDGLLNTAGGRFFGWVIGGGIPASIAADWLTSAWDQNAAAYACSPSSAIIEEVVAAWLKDLLGSAATGVLCICHRLPDGAFHGAVSGPPQGAGRPGLVGGTTGTGGQPADPRAGW